MHRSSEDVSFNIICLNVLEGIKQFYLLMWLKKTRLEIPFKGDNVKALIKTSNCDNLVLYSSENVQKIAAFAMLFWFSVTKQLFENGFGLPLRSEIPALPASLKSKRHYSMAAAFGNSVFFLNRKSCQMIGACIFMTAKEARDLMWIGSPIQNNC